MCGLFLFRNQTPHFARLIAPTPQNKEMYQQTDNRYWLREIEDKSIDYVENNLANSRSSIGDAQVRAISIYQRKQQDKDFQKSLNIGRNARFAAWIAALAAVVTLLITIKYIPN